MTLAKMIELLEYEQAESIIRTVIGYGPECIELLRVTYPSNDTTRRHATEPPTPMKGSSHIVYLNTLLRPPIPDWTVGGSTIRPLNSRVLNLGLNKLQAQPLPYAHTLLICFRFSAGNSESLSPLALGESP